MPSSSTTLNSAAPALLEANDAWLGGGQACVTAPPAPVGVARGRWLPAPQPAAPAPAGLPPPQKSFCISMMTSAFLPPTDRSTAVCRASRSLSPTLARCAASSSAAPQSSSTPYAERHSSRNTPASPTYRPVSVNTMGLAAPLPPSAPILLGAWLGGWVGGLWVGGKVQLIERVQMMVLGDSERG